MADNAAQSIKNLENDIENLNKKIIESIKILEGFDVDVADLFAKARESGIANTDKLVDYLAKRLSNLQLKNFSSPFLAAFDEKEIDRAAKKYAALLEKQDVVEKARSIAVGGRKFGELQGEDLKNWREFSALLTTINEQKKQIEQTTPGSAEAGQKLYNEQLAFQKAQETQSQERKRIAQEEADVKRKAAEDERKLNELIAEEERKKTEAAKQKYKEALEANKALTKAEDDLTKSRREQRTAESKAAYKDYFSKQLNAQKQADRESMNIQRRQIQIKAEMAAIDKKRATEGKQLTSEEKARYREISAELTKLIARQKELDAISQGSGKRARGRLSNYEITEAEKAMRRYGNAVQDARNKQQGLNNETNKMLPTIQRLASAFGVAFSVRGLAQFGKKLIETRGEFEMQFVAMKQIIGDVDAATKIWNQTMQQALQSPFKAMQLVTYTKQLAAYRIETEKLFDTTKRLADISAGLGVDMQRLILAYGQVKAANFLRASEIRQFTEAGVNVLGELSKYFTEIEGRAVSTAQVMERVTKRMVRFEDVEAIFKRMTDEGGQFFEMQEVQADTVKGQINKLHDAYDQMLNTIGKANQGTLKNMISALNRIIRNWDKVVARLKVITGLFVTYKVAQATAAIQMIKAGKAADAQSLGISGLTARLVNLIAVEKSTTESTLTLSAALKQLNSSKGGWIGVAVSAALTAAIAIADYYKRAHQLSKDLSQITTDTQIRARKSTTDYEQMAEKIRDVNTSEKERQETLSKLKRMYEDILPARMLEIEYITKEGNAYNDAKESIRAYYEEKRKQEALDKVYETYSKDVTDNQEHFASVIADIINKQTGLAVSTREINIVIDELVERFKKGEVNAQNYFEVLNQLLNTQIGVTIDREKLSKTGEGVIETFGDAVKIDEWAKRFLESVSTLDEKLEEAGANATEFGKSIKDALDTKVFDEVEKSIEKDAKALSDASFNEELDFEVSNYEKRAREAFEAFKTTFKEEYDKNPQFFEDQFEIKLKFNLEEKGIQYAKDDIEKQGKAIEHSVIDNQKTINSEIEKLAEQTSISDKEILRQFQVDTSVEFDKWIQNQLSKIDLYKTDLLRIQKGLTSDMTDEHIAMLQTLEPFLPLWEEYLKGLTPAKKTKTTRTTHENASKLISLIKEMRSEYDKLSKSAYGYAKSEEKVRESYAQSVEKILGKAGVTKDYDFTTNEGMIAALDKVLDYANKLGPEAAAEVQKYIDQLETEIEINAQVKIREDFVKEIEKSFNDYELTLELDKLNISPEAAKGLFPEFDSKTLGELQDAMQEFYKKQGEAFDEEDLKAYKQWSDKIDAEILKSRKEKAKEYSKYLEKEYSERAKVEMQYAKDVAFVTANFNGEQQKNILKGIEDKYQKDINELTWKSFKESAFYVEMMDDLSSIPMDYMQIMLGKIEELLKNPETLSPRALKEAINARQKILESLMDYDQVKVMSQSLSEIHTAMNDSEVGGTTWRQTKKRLDEQQKLKAEELATIEKEIRANETLQGQLKGLEDAQKAFNDANAKLSKETLEDLKGKDSATLMAEYNSELEKAKKDMKAFSEIEGEATSEQRDANAQLAARIEYLEIAIPLLESYKKSSEGLWAYENTKEGQNAVSAQDKGQSSTSVGSIITGQKATANNLSNRLSLLKKWQKSFVNLNNAWIKFNQNAADMSSKLGSLASASLELYDALGGETNAMTEAWKEFGSTIVDVITKSLTMIPQLVAGFTAAGITINAAMGIIGLIAEAIQLVLVLITGLSKLHDAGYEKEIENQQKKIDELQRAYDRLEKSIEKAFSATSYIKDYNEEVQNLNEQYEALGKQIDAENSKKNVDEDKLQDYKNQQQEILDNLDEIEQKKNEVFGGIDKTNYRDTAQGFVDAWKSAFLETGDGLQGLQDHFDEFLQDWFVKQATMQGVAKYYQKVFDYINGVVEDGSVPTRQDIENARLLADEAALKSDELMQAYASIFGIGGEGALSGLAAGIQGMTEEQANVLEAYWNSVRGYTANIDMNVATIVSLLSNGTNGGVGGGKGNIFGDPNVETNPMLKQLDLIAVNTAATHRILESVTKSGHSQGGYGIKVFAD